MKRVTIEKAKKLIDEYYEDAKKKDYIQNPLAWKDVHEGKSVQRKLVGVRGYGRDCVGRKQAERPENRGFQGVAI